MIRITSKKDGFRRAGMAHPATTKEYPDGHFKPEQLKALRAEPMLVVEELPDPKPDPKQAGKGGGKAGTDTEPKAKE